MKPVAFATSAAFHRWLATHHADTAEIVIVFYAKSSGRDGLTYSEALDHALCYGWIDGLRQRFDADRYTIRFTPRKPGSTWSLVNVRHVERLIADARMQPPGLAAFAARDEKKTGVYSFENRPQELPPALAKIFRTHKAAWQFWLAQPPGYRRTAIWWVISAKQDATRQRRLAQLITDSAANRRVAQLSRR